MVTEKKTDENSTVVATAESKKPTQGTTKLDKRLIYKSVANLRRPCATDEGHFSK